MTIAVGAAMVSPFVSTLPAPIPFVFLLVLTLLALFVSFFLPPPADYLPAAQRTGPHSVQLIDKLSDAPELIYLASLNNNSNAIVHLTSFTQTFSEKRRKVIRPQMNESRMDPNFYIQLSQDLSYQ